MKPSETTSIRIGDYDLKREVLLDLTKLRDPFTKVRFEPQSIPGGGKSENEVHPIPIPFWPDERSMTYEWALLHREQNQETGYDGALFRAEINGQTQYFIYHLNSDDTGDLGTIGRLVRGERPEQVVDAQSFSDRCVAWIEAQYPGERVPVIDVGYSLGGALAELVDRKGRPTVLFDSPPVSAVHDKEKVPQAFRDRNLLTVVGPHDGIYDSHGRHNGQILVAGEKFWKTDHVSILDFWRLNAHNHELSFIGKRLEKEAEWKTFPASEWKRSTHLLDAFATYIEENTQGREMHWDEKLLQKQVKFLQGHGRGATERFAEFIFGLAAHVFGADKIMPPKTHGFSDRMQAKKGQSAIEEALRRGAERPESFTAKIGQTDAPAAGRGV